MKRTRMVVVVDLIDGEIEGMSAEFRDPAVADHPAAGTPPARTLRFPKANALRAAVAQLITAAREETRPCIPC